jgi:hypothetical protein
MILGIKFYLLQNVMIQNAQSPSCRNDDYRIFGDSAVGVDSLSKTEGEGLCQTSKVNDDPQEDATLRKSTRLKKLPTNKYQDFLC